MKKTWEVMSRFIVVLLPLLALCATIYAQTGNGNIAGTVTDPSGAVVVVSTALMEDMRAVWSPRPAPTIPRVRGSFLRAVRD